MKFLTSPNNHFVLPDPRVITSNDLEIALLFMADFEKKNWSWVYGELLFVSEFNDLITKTFIYVSNMGPIILIKARDA